MPSWGRLSKLSKMIWTFELNDWDLSLPPQLNYGVDITFLVSPHQQTQIV